MNVEHHQAIIVTGRFQSKPIMDAGTVPLEEVRLKAVELFTALLDKNAAALSPLLPGSEIGIGTFLISPRGTWFGQGANEAWTTAARAFIGYLDSLRDDAGTSAVSWVHVRYGTELDAEILDSSAPRPAASALNYEEIKREILKDIDALRPELPDLANHLVESIVFDDQHQTFAYLPPPGSDPKWQRMVEDVLRKTRG